MYEDYDDSDERLVKHENMSNNFTLLDYLLFILN